MGDITRLLLGLVFVKSRQSLRVYSAQGDVMKINGNEIKPGNIISHQNGLWVAVKTNAVKPGKGGAFNQGELKT